MQQKTESLHIVSKSMGLNVLQLTPADKTNSLRVNTEYGNPLHRGGKNIEDVTSSTYLGSVVNRPGRTDDDFRVIIGKAKQAFVMLRTIWRNRNIRLKTKSSHI